jgi:hypothetical protein
MRRCTKRDQTAEPREALCRRPAERHDNDRGIGKTEHGQTNARAATATHPDEQLTIGSLICGLLATLGFIVLSTVR